MSSRYPILDNRPIHQWKVTELKEELKRRRLTTKGLKDDLVRRLDEALRAEMEAEAAESASKDDANGFEVHEGGGGEDSRTGTTDVGVVQTIEGEGVQTVQSMEKGDNDNVESIQVVETVEKGNTVVVELIDTENAEKIQEDVDVDDDSKNDKQRSVANPVDINSSVSAMDEDTEQTGLSAGVDPANVKDEQSAHASTVETSVKIIETVSTEVVVSDQDSHSAVKSNLDSAIKVENEESKLQLDIEVPKPQLECDTKPPSEDLVPNTSVPENQVSEVNPSLGSQVKSDSISSDSVSINQKNELKDTIITDNVKLEQDIVRPEMVEEPSSRKDEPVYDESHSMDVGGLLEKKASVEENSNNVTTPDLNKINSSDDVGYPEKLNLDRSSGDDSMEEDLPENKQVDSKFDVDEKDKVENIEVSIVKEESKTIVVEEVSAGKNDTHQDIDMSPVALAEKRKFNEQVSFGSNEPAKRQRRWNTETVKGSDLESTVPRAATTPKDEPVALKRNFSRSDSTVTDDAPKERIVPPSQKPPTNSLRIDRFLRPFTLKAVQELLGKTGSVSSFWMDQIKTHCYVTYASVEEAIETRNAVYNLQWPPNGGRLLVAEFVDPQEVKMKLEPPPPPPPPPSAPVIPAPAILPTPPYSQPEPSPRMRREHPPAPATLPPPPPLSKLPPAARERLPSPPPLPDKVDPPILTLDDLFRKTTATPRIYYLPLSEEQVAAKLAARSKSTRL